MTSELDRGVYYAKYYGRGGGRCQVAASCKKNVQGKEKDEKIIKNDEKFLKITPFTVRKPYFFLLYFLTNIATNLSKNCFIYDWKENIKKICF